MKIKRISAVLLSLCLALTGCGSKNGQANDEWLKKAALDADISEEELYKAALNEDILIVYTVSTRVVQTKEAFEKKYPGLYVEIRDLRSPDLIDNVVSNYSEGQSACDVVICNDNSGDFKSRLVDTGIVVPYLSKDIRAKMKEGYAGECISFINEAELFFYNTVKYKSAPVKNIWELTEGRFSGKIFIPNPLRSFSTYAFIVATFEHEEELTKAYEDWKGEAYDKTLGPVYEHLWREISKNAVFTNSSDEVMEALNNENAEIGMMVSSKLRYKNTGYTFEPIFRMDPFTGCITSVSVMLARNSGNINSAKLFIDFLLGGSDGTGDGYKPFCTPGAWSARVDVPDGTDTPLSMIDLITPDTDFLIKKKDYFTSYWSECLKNLTK